MKRKMKVYELGGKSMIRLVGNWISNFGYLPGDAIDVELCEDGSLRISHAVVSGEEHILSDSGFTSKKAR